MSGPVTDTHRITYRENFRLALQEKKDQFSASFEMYDGLSGKQAQVTDIIGTTTARLDAAEGGDTPDLDSTHEPVWMKPRRIDWGKVMTKEDMIKALTDYHSEYVRSGVAAIVRQKNILMCGALLGARLIGNEAPSSSAWAGSTVDVNVGGSNTGMNVDKILRAMRHMEEAEIVLDEEDLYLTMNPLQMEDLWSDVTFTSKDYREKAQLDDKARRATAIFGIPIIPSQRHTADGANTDVATLHCKSGMIWGEAMPLSVVSQPNPAKQYREHPYAELWLGVTRVQDAKVVKIQTYKA